MRALAPSSADRRVVAIGSFLTALVSTTLVGSPRAVEHAEPATAQAELEPPRPVWRIQTDDGVIELTNQWNAGQLDPIELSPIDAALANDWKQVDPASVPKSEQPKVVVGNPKSLSALPIALVLALGWISFVVLWMGRRHRLRPHLPTVKRADDDRVSIPVVVAGPWLRKTAVEPLSRQWVSQMPRGGRARLL